VRSDAHVRLAPCDLRGKPRGAPAVGTARILPPDETDRAERVIAANYGLGRRVYDGAINRLTTTGVYVEVHAAAT
jgi:PPOX class probable F420-dependent enzyme